MERIIELACYLILNNTWENTEKNGKLIEQLTSEEKMKLIMMLLGSLAKMQLIANITKEELYSQMKTIHPELNVSKFERDD